MSQRPSRAVLLFLVMLADVFGRIWGAFAVYRLSFPMTATARDRESPLPHHVPRYPGSLTFRFAMAHDVLHERFPRHGQDYYNERNRIVEESLRKETPVDKAGTAHYFALLDDLGVGLCLTGEHERAIALMRDKLKRQEALGYRGQELYSTYANLGTFLILWQLAEGLPGGPEAKPRIRESVAWIRKAIDVYPQSHFGREQWQV